MIILYGTAGNVSDNIDRLWGQLDSAPDGAPSGAPRGIDGEWSHDGAVLKHDDSDSDSPGEIVSDGAATSRARAASETNGVTSSFRKGDAVRPRLSEQMLLDMVKMILFST